MSLFIRILGALALALSFTTAAPAQTERPFILVASTTSTANSGLFSHLLPIFEAKTGIQVRVVAVGTGRAMRLAQNGDADVLLVHHRPSEVKFVADGFGVKRFDVMYNDFVLVGPASDPAGVKGQRNIAHALREIAAHKSPFVSRGDDSGTHKKELGLWRAAKVDAKEASGAWYRETGSGMGATLNTAAAMNAYALADRGTWLSFRNQDNLVVMSEGDKRLFNPYGVILVNPKRHPHIKATMGQRFIDWLIGEEGQQAIFDFKLNGAVLFKPSASGS